MTSSKMKNMNQIHLVFISVIVVLFISCGNPLNKVMKPMENIRTPQADYSYAVEPEFESSKEELEFKIKGLYEAEEVRLSVATYHRYDNETMEQINEDFWVHFVIYNSPTIDTSDEDEMFAVGQNIAQLIMEAIRNKDSYNKIQITFIKQWKEGEELKQIKHPEFYKYPSFEKTIQFEK